MTRTTRRSGLVLVLLGVLGAVFFWLTDPRYGPAARRTPEGSLDWRYWLFVLRGSPANLPDASRDALLSTVIGLAGCVAAVLVGLWLVSRRRV